MTDKRKRLRMDREWRFTLGHVCDPGQDFDLGTVPFSYLAKTGFGDGAAAKGFDDRLWRIVNLPHDWCVELPFSKHGTPSHGYKAIGPNFPENSIGWYRKSFFIPESDLGQPAAPWKRKGFNGLSQVIIQSTDKPGEIVLTATSPDLDSAEFRVKAEASE